MRKYIALLSVGLLAACNQNVDTSTNVPVSAATASVAGETDGQKTYVVMTELNTVPFIIRDPKLPNGITGFEYELLEAIAQRQGFKLKFEVHPWQGLFKNLDTGTADILAGAVTYTDERAKFMDFSQPHYEYQYTMLVKESLGDANGFSALRGKKIALQRGSVSESLIPMFNTENNSNILYTDTIWAAAKDAINGTADGAVGSSAPLSYYLKQYSDSKLKLVYDASLPKQHYVFAVKKGNVALQKELNDGLNKIKADGTYDQIYHHYWQ